MQEIREAGVAPAVGRHIKDQILVRQGKGLDALDERLLSLRVLSATHEQVSGRRLSTSNARTL